MRTIGYASWKGGTGKTLLAFNTLERAGANGLSALGCDLDPQRMLSRQSAIRIRNGLAKVDVDVVEADLTVEGIEQLTDAQQKAEYDLIVCDMPGTDTFVMDRALSIMDAILIPVNGAPYEILNTARMTQRVSQKGWNAFLIPNNVPPTQKRKNETADTVGQMGAPISPVAIVRRIVHWDAGMVGLTVNEFAPASPAAAEIREYWAWLQGALGISRNSFPSAKELAYA
jgi:chromosome partitioning protein